MGSILLTSEITKTPLESNNYENASKVKEHENCPNIQIFTHVNSIILPFGEMFYVFL